MEELADISYEIDAILAGFEWKLDGQDKVDCIKARELLLNLVCKIKKT